MNHSLLCICPECLRDARRVLEEFEKREFQLLRIKQIFHTLWGVARDIPNYDKGMWVEFQRYLRELGVDA